MEVLVVKGDTPKSARNNWQLWKLCKNLTTEEIKVLIAKRKNQLKYEENKKEILKLKSDISILEDSYSIIKRRNN